MDTTLFRKPAKSSVKRSKSTAFGRQQQWVADMVASDIAAKDSGKRFADAVAAADAVELTGDVELAAQMRYDALFAE